MYIYGGRKGGKKWLLVVDVVVIFDVDGGFWWSENREKRGERTFKSLG